MDTIDAERQFLKSLIEVRSDTQSEIVSKLMFVKYNNLLSSRCDDNKISSKTVSNGESSKQMSKSGARNDRDCQK